jgi:hypothetical protein
VKDINGNIKKALAAFHFNGDDWEKIESINKENGSVIRAWSTDTETLLVGQDWQAEGTLFPISYVLRGK